MTGSKQQQENQVEHSGLTSPRSKELEEGEVICNECKGSGVKPSKHNPQGLASFCWKCSGNGKLDWVSNAMGTPKRQYYGSSSYVHTSTSGYGIAVKKHVVVTYPDT